MRSEYCVVFLLDASLDPNSLRCQYKASVFARITGQSDTAH